MQVESQVFREHSFAGSKDFSGGPACSEWWGEKAVVLSLTFTLHSATTPFQSQGHTPGAKHLTYPGAGTTKGRKHWLAEAGPFHSAKG